MGFVGQLAVLAAAVTLATLLALAAGAPNLGTALTFGQIAFAAALAGLVVRR